MHKGFLILIIGYMAVVGALAGCAAENGASPDSGSDGDGGNLCVSDNDCQPPETCQEDGTCAFVPKPEDNRAAGSFDLEMGNLNVTLNDVEVQGKLDGKYIYLGVGGFAEFDSESQHVNLEFFGMLTNTLYYDLVIQLPKSCPLEQEIRIGAGGVAVATLDQVRTNSEGEVVERITVREVVGGFVAFSSFGTVLGDQLVGTVTAEFKPVIP